MDHQIPLADLIEQKLEFILEQIPIDVNTWEIKNVSTNPPLLVGKKIFSNCDVPCFLGMGTVKKTKPEQLMNFIWDVYQDPIQMKKSDPDIAEYQILDTVNDHTRICHQVNNLSWPLWQRDMVYCQSKIIHENSCWLIMFSMQSEKAPRSDDKYVRALVHISAYGFVPDDDHCTVYRFAHVDPAGYIPTSLLNSYGDKTVTMIKEMQQQFL